MGINTGEKMHNHYCPYCTKEFECPNDPDCGWPQYAMCPRCEAESGRPDDPSGGKGHVCNLNTYPDCCYPAESQVNIGYTDDF